MQFCQILRQTIVFHSKLLDDTMQGEESPLHSVARFRLTGLDVAVCARRSNSFGKRWALHLNVSRPFAYWPIESLYIAIDRVADNLCSFRQTCLSLFRRK